MVACGGGSDKKEEPTEKPATAETDDGELDIQRLAESVVMVAPGVYSGNDFEPIATGSGTVVDESGLILTNWHVVDPDNVGVYEDVAVT
jgi:S1-C subfamily serine protease